MSIEEGFKRIYAEDLALGLGFTWDYENARDWDLYEAIEAMGYSWDGRSWLAPVAAAPAQKRTRRRKPIGDADRDAIYEELRQFEAGEPIRRGGG